jgi:iron(III) transport system permease protein
MKFLNIRFSLVISLLIALLFIFPFIFLVIESLKTLANIANIDFITIIYVNLKNSLLLALFTCLLASLIALPAAWIMSYYDFPFKKLFNFLLILPLAIPAYILGITYAEFTETKFLLSIRNIYGASLILSFALYPYIYLFCKNYFKHYAPQIFQAKIYGMSNIVVFYKIALRFILPALITANILIIMEVMGEFGLASYYGINSLTTAIYKEWFMTNNYSNASLQSGILLFVILVFYLLEYLIKRKKSYSDIKNISQPIYNALASNALFASYLFFIIITTLAFFIPVIQIIIWCVKNTYLLFDSKFLHVFFNSFFLALIGSIIIIFSVFFIFITAKLYNSKLMKFTNFVSVIGYAIPGSVIAVAILFVLNIFLQQISYSYNIFTSLAIIGLIYAYQIRFSTLAYNNFNIAWNRVDSDILNMAKIYRKNDLILIFNYFFRLMSTSIGIAFILIFIEIIKELPATLILRPFNFDSLATRTYMLAADEMVIESAISALAIILFNVIAIFIFSKYFEKYHVYN